LVICEARREEVYSLTSFTGVKTNESLGGGCGIDLSEDADGLLPRHWPDKKRSGRAPIGR